jgi:hypothetical protein
MDLPSMEQDVSVSALAEELIICHLFLGYVMHKRYGEVTNYFY